MVRLNVVSIVTLPDQVIFVVFVLSSQNFLPVDSELYRVLNELSN